MLLPSLNYHLQEVFLAECLLNLHNKLKIHLLAAMEDQLVANLYQYSRLMMLEMVSLSVDY
jgi:hypothetical protein